MASSGRCFTEEQTIDGKESSGAVAQGLRGGPSITAMLSFSVAPPLCHSPCPGLRTKLVARPNFSISFLRKASNHSLPMGCPQPVSFGRRNLHELRGPCAHDAFRSLIPPSQLPKRSTSPATSLASSSIPSMAGQSTPLAPTSCIWNTFSRRTIWPLVSARCVSKLFLRVWWVAFDHIGKVLRDLLLRVVPSPRRHGREASRSSSQSRHRKPLP
jgi:hypothetical protein